MKLPATHIFGAHLKGGAHMGRLVPILLAGLLLSAGAIRAQQAMTNADVVRMVKAGLSAELIVTTVKNAPARDFDVSPDALVKLKAEGVSETIIAAMLGGGAVQRESEPDATVVIPDGTEVRLKLMERLSSASTKINDRVRLQAAEDVLVDGKVVIAKGAEAFGTVTEARPKKSFGRSGKLNFSIDVVKALDGQNIRLRATKENRGDESFGKAGVVTILAGPFGALVRGKDVEIEPGTEYSIYIDGNREVRLAKGQQP